MNKHYFPLLLCLLFMGYSGAINPPRMRLSPYFGNPLGMKYTRIEDLGEHKYDGGLFDENNDLIYTAGAGYIDMGHLRESADRTRYLFEICLSNIQTQSTEFSFQVIEPAEYRVHIDYPSNWDTLDSHEKQRIGRKIAIDLGQHFAYLSAIWHEIVTWYGYASTGWFSEQISSFSWEDGYSDLLGAKLAARVLKENEKDYDHAMTEIIRQELKKLNPQSIEIARQATKRIYGKWFSGRFPSITMKKRNFDIGFEDGQITPFRVPGICSGAPEISCSLPLLDSLALYGFTIRLEIIPRESDRNSILSILYPAGGETAIEPDTQFPLIIRHIRDEAIKKDGLLVDKPTL
jgi:hypothetical protein